MSVKLSTIKAIYLDVLTKLYTRSEAENYFYIVLQWLEKKSKTDVIVGNETLLQSTYLDLLSQLEKSVPIQYLTNEAPFYGLDLYVDERTLIPRPETEQLVHLILEENQGFSGKILDIGTGSGCIALTLKKNLPNATVSGCDISLDALEVAKKNAHLLNIDVDFFELGVLNDTITPSNIVVSNPPYIALEEKVNMESNVIDYEPDVALFVDAEDPLLFYKTIVKKALKNKGTVCYFETSEFYRTELDEWLASSNYQYVWKSDFQLKDRILKVWH